MGRPKALVTGRDGEPWLSRATSALAEAGAAPVIVVLGAEADHARHLVPTFAHTVVAPDWADGMSASMRVGLEAALDTDADAIVVLLVDLPDVGADVLTRLLEGREGPAVLARAAYDGVPGHPVLIGRDHWEPLSRSLVGDQGAKSYLGTHDHDVVECGDLATGEDADTPDQV